MWWESLNLFQQIFFCIATAASVFLIVQIVLLLIGLGGDGDIDGDFDGDVSVDAGVDVDSGLSIFTVKTLTAFFAVGGWVGFTLGDGNLTLAIILALVAGIAAMFLIALALKAITKLQSNGNIRLNDAIGSIAEVYLTIPAVNTGEGKVTLLLNERLIEQPAIQEGTEAIKTGSKVKIIKIINNSFVVEKI